MSPYRLPPPKPSVAPRAPWWRVAWAVFARGLGRRSVERAMRRRALVLPVPESFRQLTASQWRDLHPFTQRCLLDAFERERAKPWIAEARLWRMASPWRPAR